MDQARADRYALDWRDRVEHWDDARHEGSALAVTLRDGWCFGEEGEHVGRYSTVTAAWRAVRDARRCHCPRCERHRTAASA
jgi:hypothetical protein